MQRAFVTTSPTVAGGLLSASSSLTRTDAERPHAQLSRSMWPWIVDNLVPSLFNMVVPFDWRASVMSAALALGHALGVPPLVMAELLPVIEAVMVHKLNAEITANDGPSVTP